MSTANTTLENIGREFLRWVYTEREKFFSNDSNIEICQTLEEEGFIQLELYDKEKHVCNGAHGGDAIYVFTRKFFDITGEIEYENAVAI